MSRSRNLAAASCKRRRFVSSLLQENRQTNKQVNTFVYIIVLVRNFMSLILRWGSIIVTAADDQLTGLTIVILFLKIE